MALRPFQDEQLNYFKFASIVLDEFPKALRQTFKSMWDKTFKHLPSWNDSILVRKMFRTKEGSTTKVPTDLSYEEWDCTALFRATIYARSFALGGKGHCKTLSDLYVKPHKLAHGKFHVSVISSRGDDAETFALAIDQLRLLRNTLFHSTSSEIVKATFDQYVQLAKDAFKALGVMTGPIDVIGGLAAADFPIEKVRKLEETRKEETLAYINFLRSNSESIEEIKGVLTKMKEDMANKEDIAMLTQRLNDRREVPAQEKAGKTNSVVTHV